MAGLRLALRPRGSSRRDHDRSASRASLGGGPSVQSPRTCGSAARIVGTGGGPRSPAPPRHGGRIEERDVRRRGRPGPRGVRELLIAPQPTASRTFSAARSATTPRVSLASPTSLTGDDATGVDIALLSAGLSHRQGASPSSASGAPAPLRGRSAPWCLAADLPGRVRRTGGGGADADLQRVRVGTDAAFLDRALAMALISAGVARVVRRARCTHRSRRFRRGGVAVLHPGRADLRGGDGTRVPPPVLG